VTNLQNLERVEAEMPLEEMVVWMAAGAINLMDENRDFLRIITIEGLGGDEAALAQYSRLLDLWENALTAVLKRYENQGLLHGDDADDLARHIIYTIMMAFQDSLLGRHGFSGPTAEQRQEALRSFLGPSLVRLLSRA
jgi:hypothetical protein